MTNLGGHDLPSLLEAFDKIDHDRPTCFIAYTIKGFGLPFAGHKDNHAGLMTPAQMETLPQRDGHPRRATNGTGSRACARRPSELQAFLDTRAVRGRAARAGSRRRSIAVPDDARGRRSSRTMSTQVGFGALLNELGARADAARRAHRHHLAGRHGLDQSRAVGEPPRPVRAREHGRHVQERAHPLDLQLGVLAEGPAHRARHRRDATCSSCCRRSACRTRSTASGCCRSARSTIRSSRAASMR